jgi:hypothetical protein
MAFLKDLVTTLAYDFVLIFSYLGLGWVFSRALSIKLSGPEKIFSFVWMGWSFSLILLQTINIFSPIGILGGASILLAGLILAFLFLRTDIGSFIAVFKSPLWLGLTMLAATSIAAISLPSPIAYDSGLYHFNTIRWWNEYPIVLGLGNLHLRLAFNQSFFAYVAQLNLYPIFKNGHHIANGFLVFVLLSEQLFSLSKYITSRQERLNLSASSMAAIFMIPVTIYLILNAELSSPKPDTAASILQILIFVHFIRALEDINDENYDSRMLLVFVLSATAITVKLSNLVYVLTICLILLIVRIKHWQLPLKQAIIRTTRLLLAPAFIIALWCFRGYLMSGCPLFPSTFGCIQTRWSIPIQITRDLADLIYSWARIPRGVPETVLSQWDWLIPWFNLKVWGQKPLVVYPLTVALLGAVAAMVISIYIPSYSRLNYYFLLLPLPVLTGLFFWFFTAPSVRFVLSLLFLLPVTVAVILIKVLESKQRFRHSLILTLFLITNINVLMAIFQGENPLEKFPVHGYMPTKEVRLVSNTTLSGLEVFSPFKDNQCWDSILPCTPEFREELEFDDKIIFPEFRLPVAKQP